MIDEPDIASGARKADSLTELQLAALKSVARARSYLFVCFYTLPLYVLILMLLLNSQRSITGFMFFYMGVYAVFAVNMSIQRCPRCREQFFVKHMFLNPVTRRCAHCGLSTVTSHREKF